MDQSSQKHLEDIEKGERLKSIFEMLNKEKKRFERIANSRQLTEIERREYESICSKLHAFYEKCRAFIKPRKNGPGKFMVEGYVNWCVMQRMNHDEKVKSTPSSFLSAQNYTVMNGLNYEKQSPTMRKTKSENNHETPTAYAYNRTAEPRISPEKYTQIPAAQQEINTPRNGFENLNGRMQMHFGYRNNTGFQRGPPFGIPQYMGPHSPYMKTNKTVNAENQQLNGYPPNPERYFHQMPPNPHFSSGYFVQPPLRNDEYLRQKKENYAEKTSIKTQKTSRKAVKNPLSEKHPVSNASKEFIYPQHLQYNEIRERPHSENTMFYNDQRAFSNFNFMESSKTNLRHRAKKEPFVHSPISKTISKTDLNRQQITYPNPSFQMKNNIGIPEHPSMIRKNETRSDNFREINTPVTISARRRRPIQSEEPAKQPRFSFEFNCEKTLNANLNTSIPDSNPLLSDKSFKIKNIFSISDAFHSKFLPNPELSNLNRNEFVKFLKAHQSENKISDELTIAFMIHLDTVFHKTLLISSMIAQIKNNKQIEAEDLKFAFKKVIGNEKTKNKDEKQKLKSIFFESKQMPEE